MRIRRLPRGDREAATAFVDLPYRLNADAPQWAPDGLYREQFRRMDPNRHPFYAHSEADFFVAEEGGEVVGRVAAIDNRRFNEHKGTNEAFFGYLEMVDDGAVAARLLETVAEWASRRGLEELSGPRGLLGFDGSVLVEGFELPAVVGVPWNRPHYGAAIEGAGFAGDEDYLSGFMDTATAIPEGVMRLADRVVAKGTYAVKSFDSRRELTAWAPRIKDAYLTSVAELDSFYPPTDDEIDDLLGTVLTIADPRGIKLVLADGEIAGFLFCYPDLAPALRATGGRLWPLGWARLLWERSHTDRYCINGLGMLPDHRGRGGNAVLYTAITRTAIEIGMEGAEVVQVAAHNAASFKDMEKIGTRWQKRHRRYRRALT
ncbi:MAG: GNAT family N-acetyltransferase [Acidimicrobiia bacterium]